MPAIHRLSRSGWALLLCLFPLITAAQLEVVEFREDPLNLKAITHPVQDMNADTCAIIRIESNIAGRVDITGVTVYKTDIESAGIIDHYIRYRERNFTITASGFMPLYYKTLRELEKGKVYILRLKAQGGGGSRIQESAEVRLIYSPASDEEIYGGLDGDVNFIDFSSGERKFRPSPGAHTIRLNSKGCIWERRYELQAGQKVEERVEFISENREDWAIGQPGGLYIESIPPGATVYMNRVEQGVTPLTLNKVQPGKYSIEVTKDLYLPDSLSVEVKSLEFAKFEFELTPNFGRLKITSVPTGSMVWINNQQRGETTLEIPRFNAGIYSLRLVQNLYHEETDTFEIKPDGEFIKEYRLRPRFGSVNLTSKPPGAKVEVQGMSWGQTPMTRDSVPSGEYIIKLSLVHYFDEEVTIRVNDEEALIKNFPLRPRIGWLSVTSEPSGAKVTVMETKKVLGETPIQDLPIERGSYRIVIEKELFEPFETAVAVTYGGKQSVDAILQRTSGHLRVSTIPQGAKIYLDNRYRDETPTVVKDIPIGIYPIRLEKSGFDTQAGRVEIKRNEVVEYTRTLGAEGTKEWLKRKIRTIWMSALVPGGGQVVASRQTIKGLIYFAAFTGVNYMAYDSYVRYESAKDDYYYEMDKYYNASLQYEIYTHYNAMMNHQQRMDDFDFKHKVFLAAAGGIWAWNIIDALIWGGGKKPVVYTDLQKKGGKIEFVFFPNKLGIVVNF